MKEVWYNKISCRAQTSKSFNEIDDSSIKFSYSQQLTKGFADLESITHA